MIRSKAIREFCMGCMLNQKTEIRLCPNTQCDLHRYRMTVEIKEFKYDKPRVPRGKAIRLKCIDCSGGELKEVRECEFTNCALHKYRMHNVKKVK